MTNACTRPADLPDDHLLIELRRSVAAERSATTRLIELLAEVDTRRLYLAEGCSSLFTYCTDVLHLSEHAAYGRIEAARLARRVADVLEALRSGDATLTTICLIGPHLTPSNCSELLAAVRHKSKREVERLVASLAPKPEVPASVRKVPVRAATEPQGGVTQTAAWPSLNSAIGAPQATPSLAAECSDGPPPEMPAAMTPRPARPSVVAPLAPERYKIQFTASRDLHDKLRRAQDLLRHAVPDGDVAAIFDRALTLLVEDLERRKLAAAARPRPPRSLTSESRYIPAAVKRLVWARDDGRCTFVGTQGRCTERGFLEFHHLVPFAAGGETSADNLALRCRAHNQFEAEQFFGPLFARETRWRYDIESARSGPSSSATETTDRGRGRAVRVHERIEPVFLLTSHMSDAYTAPIPLSNPHEHSRQQGHGREVRHPARHSRPHGPQDTRRDGFAARLRHRAPHRTGGGGRAAGQSGHDLSVPGEARAERLDCRRVGNVRQQSQGEVLHPDAIGP